MKKLMIVLVALMAVVSVAHAKFGDTETTVIKDGNVVRVFHAKDVTRDSYSWTEFEITSYTSANLSAGELKSFEIPEGAWKLCSSNESGVYSTKEAKLAAENKELKDAKYDLEEENSVLIDDKKESTWTGIGLFILLIIFLIRTLILEIKLKKEKRR